MYDKILALDRELFLQINFDGGGFMDNLMVICTSKLFLAAALVASLIYLYRKKMPLVQILYTAMAIGLIILLADQTCNFFKNNTPRLRPMHEPLLDGLVYLIDGMRGGNFGTVSAHAANSVGTLFFLSLLIRKPLFWSLAAIAATLIMYSRIYLGYHYPLDLFYGIITGLIYGFVTYKIYTYIVKRFVKKR